MKKIWGMLFMLIFLSPFESRGWYDSQGGYSSISDSVYNHTINPRTDPTNPNSPVYQARIHIHSNDNEINKIQIKYYNGKVNTFCSSQGYEKTKCDKYCKSLKSYDGSNNLCEAAVAPKKVVAIGDPKLGIIAKERAQWKMSRQESLAKLKQVKDDFTGKFKEKFTEEKCAKIQEKVQEKTNNFDNISTKYTQVYANLVGRINKFIARFDEMKLDTIVIKNHAVELQTKIDKFSDDYIAYTIKLKETKTITCGHSEGEFRESLAEAKEFLKIVHDDSADIRTYVHETIFVDIKDLKAQTSKEGSTINNTNDAVVIE